VEGSTVRRSNDRCSPGREDWDSRPEGIAYEVRGQCGRKCANSLRRVGIEHRASGRVRHGFEGCSPRYCVHSRFFTGRSQSYRATRWSVPLPSAPRQNRKCWWFHRVGHQDNHSTALIASRSSAREPAGLRRKSKFRRPRESCEPPFATRQHCRKIPRPASHLIEREYRQPIPRP